MNALPVEAGADNAATRIEKPFQERMAMAWAKFSGHILLVLSEDDYTAKEFVEHAKTNAGWQKNLEKQSVIRHDVADVDHTFSSAEARMTAENLALNWLVAQFSSPALQSIGAPT